MTLKQVNAPVFTETADPKRAGGAFELPFVFVLLASLACWAILFLAIPPAKQNFPLLDDWAWARSTFLFAHTGTVAYDFWAAMPQLGQWLLASPFVWVTGDSFVALRLSTFVISCLGLAAVYDLARQESRLSPCLSAMITAALAFNPLFFTLQGTYMTDVPALSLALISLALYSRTFQSRGLFPLVMATFVALLAVSTRQNAIAVPLVAGCQLYRSGRLRIQPPFWLAVLVPAVVGLAVHFWFESRADVIHYRPTIPEPHFLLILPFLIVHYFGLSAVPLLALRPLPMLSRTFFLGLLYLFSSAIYWGVWYGYRIPHGGLFPYWDGVFSPYGVYSEGLVAGSRPLLLGMTSRLFLSVLGCFLGAELLARWLRGLNAVGSSTLLWFTLFQIPFLLITPRFYDRYLIFLMPGALVLLAHGTVGRARWSLSVACLAVLAALSTCLMHDWLAWNSARWRLGDEALAMNIAPGDIEGGFEWDGKYSPKLRLAKHAARRGLTQPLNQQFFPYITGKYALSFSELPGTAVIASEAYSQWLLPGPHRFFLLRLIDGSKRTFPEQAPSP